MYILKKNCILLLGTYLLLEGWKGAALQAQTIMLADLQDPELKRLLAANPCHKVEVACDAHSLLQLLSRIQAQEPVLTPLLIISADLLCSLTDKQLLGLKQVSVLAYFASRVNMFEHSAKIVAMHAKGLRVGALVNPCNLIREVQEEVPSPTIAACVKGRFTERQVHILQLIANGMSSNDIAAALGVKFSTIQAHLRRIFRNLNVNSRAAAVTIAARDGLIK